MDIGRVKYKLNHIVRLTDERYDLNAEYILTGCIIRQNEQGFYYQAELKDVKANSVLVVSLKNVMEM